jgi:glycosyltransferase involved in cell wall biosynthesis
MADPDVSVLTPSFGYAAYIGDALASVAGQEDVVVQHVVQDGASTDGTVRILEAFGPRVDWRSEPDEGQSDALNRALDRAQGRWVSWLNADEFYLPGALSHLVATAESLGVDIVYGDAVFVDADGRLQRLLAQHRFDRTALWHYGTIIPSCAVLIRRSIMGSSPWDGTLRLLMDRELYMRLVAAGATAHHSKRPIGAFRVHEQRVSAAPSTAFDSDYRTISERYEPTSKAKRIWALGRHRTLKLLDGSYGRQRRVVTAEGRDLRWFRDDVGAEGCRELFDLYRPEPSAAS